MRFMKNLVAALMVANCRTANGTTIRQHMLHPNHGALLSMGEVETHVWGNNPWTSDFSAWNQFLDSEISTANQRLHLFSADSLHSF